MGRGEHLGGLEAMVLATVARVGEDANGAAVYVELERRTGRDPTLPAVHVTLRRLEEKGYLSSEEGTPSERGGRPRRWYRLTPQGLDALREFRSAWSALWRGVDLEGGR